MKKATCFVECTDLVERRRIRIRKKELGVGMAMAMVSFVDRARIFE